jgi:hypothetical protein
MRKARFVFSQLTPKQKVRKNAEEQTKEFTPETGCVVVVLIAALLRERTIN